MEVHLQVYPVHLRSMLMSVSHEHSNQVKCATKCQKSPSVVLTANLSVRMAIWIF